MVPAVVGSARKPASCRSASDSPATRRAKEAHRSGKRAKAAEILPFKAANGYPPEQLQPLMDEPAEATPTVTAGLSLERFSALARKGFKGKAAIAAVLGCEVAQVVERIESMTDTEREVLADELNLDWR